MKKTIIVSFLLAQVCAVNASESNQVLRPVFDHPSKRLCPADMRQKIDATTNLLELLPYYRENNPIVVMCAENRLLEISLNSIVAQRQTLGKIKVVVEKNRPYYELQIHSVAWNLANEFERNSVNEAIAYLSAIKTWDDMYEAINENGYSVYGFFHLILCKANELYAEDKDIKRFRDFFKKDIEDMSKEVVVDKTYETKRRMAIRFLAKSSPTQETIDLLKWHQLKSWEIYERRKSTLFLDVDIFVSLYNINSSQADSALLDLFKTALPKIHKEPVVHDDAYAALELLCDMLRDAQIDGVTPVLRKASADESIHESIRDAAKESADWRDKNSKFK